MANSKLTLDERSPLKDGTCPVRISVGWGTKLYLSTSIYVNPPEWDSRSQMVVGKNGKRINAILQAQLQRVTSLLLELREREELEGMTKAQIRAYLKDPNAARPNSVSLGEWLERVAGEKKKRNTRLGYLGALRQTWRVGNPYETPLTSVNRSWVRQFSTAMAGMSASTHNVYIARMRYVMRRAMEEELIPADPFVGIKLRRTEPNPRPLPIEAFRTLLTSSHHRAAEAARKLFLLGFYLRGINLADLYELSSDNIKDGRIRYVRKKTGKRYSVKIEPEAEPLIREFISGRGLSGKYSSFASLSNTWARSIKKLPNVPPAITWYSARYSWASYAMHLRIPLDEISEGLGHTYGASVTRGYILFDETRPDAAHRRVLDFVLKK